MVKQHTDVSCMVLSVVNDIFNEQIQDAQS